MGVDPVGYQLDNIHSFNRYAFANNNPYKYVDPDGRNPLILSAIVNWLAPALAAGALVVVFKSWMTSLAAANGAPAFDQNASNGALELNPTHVTATGSFTPAPYHNEDEKAEASNGEKPRGRDWRGEPHSTSAETKGGDARRFAKDGFPEVDHDAPHPNESGVGNNVHVHNWGRPADGSPATHKDRGGSFEYSPLPRRR